MTYTYTKKQIVEILNVSPAKIEKLVKDGKLTRQRKTPGNNRSTWLYSAEEIGEILDDCNPTGDLPCCEPAPETEKSTRKWYEFWK